MIRRIIAASFSLLAAAASAAPLYHPMGPNLTFGDVAHGQSIMAGINNPAAGATAIRDDGDTVQFGIWNGFGVGYEVGEVDNLFDTIDQQIDDLQNSVVVGSTPQELENDISATVNSLNETLRSIDESGNYKAFVSVHLPIVPLLVSSDFLGGTIVFDGHMSAATNAHVLQDDVQFISLNDPNDDINYDGGTQTFTVENNDSTLLAKGTLNTELSLGYSRELLSTPLGKLYAGVRGKYLRVGLIRLNEPLVDLVDAENIDDYDYTDSTAVGLDAGLLLIASHYRIGATLNNVNEPSFEFNDIINAGSYNTSGEVYRELAADNEYVMESQLKLEGALYTEDQNWIISVGMDANAVEDALGDEYQWATVSAAYVNEGFILPGLRFGMRQNLAGTELNYLTAGLTLFGALNLDLAYGTDSVEVDEESVPQGLMFNLGLDVTF